MYHARSTRDNHPKQTFKHKARKEIRKKTYTPYALLFAKNKAYMRYVNDIGHIAEHDIYWNYFDKRKRKLCEDASFNPTPAKQCPLLCRHDRCRSAN
jgi:hypothetical protein